MQAHAATLLPPLPYLLLLDGCRLILPLSIFTITLIFFYRPLPLRLRYDIICRHHLPNDVARYHFSRYDTPIYAVIVTPPPLSLLFFVTMFAAFALRR